MIAFIIDILIVSVSIISVFFTYKVYSKLKGFLLLDILINFKGFENHEECNSLINIINFPIENGFSNLLKDEIYVKLNIKNIGYQSVTIESCYIKKIAFLPDDNNQSILKGRTFSELNSIVLEKCKSSENFIDSKGVLNYKLNIDIFTVGRLKNNLIDISECFNDILFELEGAKLSYYFIDIYCIDTLGRKWVLCKKSNELLGKYSIGIRLSLNE